MNFGWSRIASISNLVHLDPRPTSPGATKVEETTPTTVKEVIKEEEGVVVAIKTEASTATTIKTGVASTTTLIKVDVEHAPHVRFVERTNKCYHLITRIKSMKGTLLKW